MIIDVCICVYALSITRTHIIGRTHFSMTSENTLSSTEKNRSWKLVYMSPVRKLVFFSSSSYHLRSHFSVVVINAAAAVASFCFVSFRFVPILSIRLHSFCSTTMPSQFNPVSQSIDPDIEVMCVRHQRFKYTLWLWLHGTEHPYHYVECMTTLPFTHQFVYEANKYDEIT